MENYQGDLNDIILASNKGAKAYGSGMAPETLAGLWHHQSFPSHDHPFFTPVMDDRTDNFGDPFCNMKDPLLDAIQAPNSGKFNSANSSNIMYAGVEDSTGSFSNNISTTFTRTAVEQDSMGPGDMYSHVLGISPEDKLSAPPCDSTTMAVSCGAIKNNFQGVDPNSQYISKNCLVENTGMMQISSPRNIGIKRRKNQTKKVVCIPAPTAANSRATGEVVPSDLWAWRKYGQKPIKGSPYPRGYYRCSSSKGCSARKQVERSRTDPNMLVITYTSEHNHPWPTQRNALAGSTRSHPSKHTSKTQPSHSPPNNNTPSSSTVKEETDHDSERKVSNLSNNGQIEDQDPHFNLADQCSNDQSSEDFFAELGELDADSLSDILLDPADQHNNVESKGSDPDPFNNILEWLSSEDQKRV